MVDSISTPIKSYWLCDIVNEITLRLLALECQGTWWMHHRHQFLLTWRIPKYVNTKPHQWSHQDPWSLTRISYHLTCCRILILGVSMSMCNIGSEEKNAESRTCQHLKVTVLWRSNHLMHFTIFIFSVDFPADEHETRALVAFVMNNIGTVLVTDRPQKQIFSIWWHRLVDQLNDVLMNNYSLKILIDQRTSSNCSLDGHQ